jgi:uncharacterized membrane protein
MMDFNALTRAESTPGPLVIRTIGVMDLKDALARGMSDFLAMPTHALFLCLIYPIVGLILARVSLGYDILSLLFPLAAGFALLGPFAAIGLYELSRQREQGLDPSWQDAFDVLHVPSRGDIATLGLLLLVVFVLWIVVAEAIYVANFGREPAASIPDFVRQVFTTPAGWMLIIVGNGIGFLFALAVLIISVVSFPLLLDRDDVRANEAVLTSVRAVAANPVPMAIWGLIVASLLIIGSLPFFVGLAVVVPVLGHSTWHLYRKVVEPNPNARHEHLRPAPKSGRHYAAQFPAALFGGEKPPTPPPLKPVFEPATGRGGASRTGRPELLLTIAAGMVYAVVVTFFWAEVWTALAVVFVAAPVLFITAIILVAKTRAE